MTLCRHAQKLTCTPIGVGAPKNLFLRQFRRCPVMLVQVACDSRRVEKTMRLLEPYESGGVEDRIAGTEE